MLGKLLGENKLELVKAYSRRFMVLIPAVAFVLGVIIALFSPLLLSMFNVGEESLGYAQKMMVIFALTMPFRAGELCHCSRYFKKRRRQSVLLLGKLCGPLGLVGILWYPWCSWTSSSGILGLPDGFR